MIENVIAIRYAKGLAEIAHEQGALAAVQEDLEQLGDILDPNRGEISVPELVEFLGSPTVPPADKIQLTDVLCEKLSVGKTVSDFLNLLIHRHRVSLFSRILTEYCKLATKLEQIQTAQVETARPLTPAQEDKIRASLELATGAKVRLTVRVNPALLAGVRMRLGDQLLDGSLENRLERLAAKLT